MPQMAHKCAFNIYSQLCLLLIFLKLLTIYAKPLCLFVFLPYYIIHYLFLYLLAICQLSFMFYPVFCYVFLIVW